MKNLIKKELVNKMCMRINNNIEIPEIMLVDKLKIHKLTDFSLIKSITNIELISGQRPVIAATLLKKSLIVNLKVTNKYTESLVFLQKEPVNWKKYLTPINVSEYYFVNKKLTLINHKINRLENWVKSAYLD